MVRQLVGIRGWGSRLAAVHRPRELHMPLAVHSRAAGNQVVVGQEGILAEVASVVVDILSEVAWVAGGTEAVDHRLAVEEESRRGDIAGVVDMQGSQPSVDTWLDSRHSRIQFFLGN